MEAPNYILLALIGIVGWFLRDLHSRFKDTVRKSLDEQFFIVEGDTITTYTQAEMLVICEGANWTDNMM